MKRTRGDAKMAQELREQIVWKWRFCANETVLF